MFLFPYPLPRFLLPSFFSPHLLFLRLSFSSFHLSSSSSFNVFSYTYPLSILLIFVIISAHTLPLLLYLIFILYPPHHSLSILLLLFLFPLTFLARSFPLIFLIFRLSYFLLSSSVSSPLIQPDHTSATRVLEHSITSHTLHILNTGWEKDAVPRAPADKQQPSSTFCENSRTSNVLKQNTTYSIRGA